MPITIEVMREFLKARYKHDRLYGRGDEYGDLVVANAAHSLNDNGGIENLARCVSHFESITGREVWYIAHAGAVVEVAEVRYDRARGVFVPRDPQAAQPAGKG